MFTADWKEIHIPCVLTAFLRSRALKSAKKKDVGQAAATAETSQTPLTDLFKQPKTGKILPLTPFPFELEILVEEFKVEGVQVSDIYWSRASVDKLFESSPYIETFGVAEAKRLYRRMCKDRSFTLTIGWKEDDKTHLLHPITEIREKSKVSQQFDRHSVDLEWNPDVDPFIDEEKYLKDRKEQEASEARQTSLDWLARNRWLEPGYHSDTNYPSTRTNVFGVSSVSDRDSFKYNNRLRGYPSDFHENWYDSDTYTPPPKRVATTTSQSTTANASKQGVKGIQDKIAGLWNRGSRNLKRQRKTYQDYLDRFSWGSTQVNATAPSVLDVEGSSVEGSPVEERSAEGESSVPQRGEGESLQPGLANMDAKPGEGEEGRPTRTTHRTGMLPGSNGEA